MRTTDLGINTVKTIFERIKETPVTLMNVEALRRPVVEYMDTIIELYEQRITDADQTNKCLNDIETAYNELRLSLLN